MKNLSLTLLLVCAACAQNSRLETLGGLPSALAENSACEVVGNTIWTAQDHGNEPIVYALDRSGKLLKSVMVTNANNEDWEELTSDDAGNLYIGDFGNNDNKRRDLAIFKISASELSDRKASVSQKTTFHYLEQTEFPPKKSERFFDCEAFFEKDGHFYLFTKNRSANFDGTTFLYKIPNKPGHHVAKKLGEFKTCCKFNRCAITAADISPDGRKVALLTGDKVFLFTGFSSDAFFDGKVETIELDHFSQKEGLGFATNDEILITDEKTKKIGGTLYRLDLSEAKP
ncbi:hypothetical protein [Flavobacterium selenitireducens]|uniref:hypothetical protein n=1 Tax=Flavobacterium selenitireducens TaxID=2722704 RepID=UPI00168B8400|nr:hypothetical protein [Flavobacterium selenitireducens]MBD3583346.1 hypothetical protein [Flavobacterium selenitireducens]